MWPFLWLAYLGWCRFFPQMILLLGAIFYGWYHLPPSLPLDKEIEAIFSPSSLQPHQSPFQKGLVYKGTLFFDHRSLACSIYYRKPIDTHPKANTDFVLKGKLAQRGQTDFFFKPKEWISLPSSWSFAEFRYQTKEKFRHILSEYLPSPRVSSFLSALVTGDVEDRLLRYEFSRLGLQHILGISGFHFAILIAFCSFILDFFLSRSWKIIALFLAINAYFLFVGSAPAVQRSWLTALFYLLGQWLNRPTSGLNLLGCALCTELILNPLISQHLGFQFSFLSCIGILLFHPFFDQKLQILFPNRTRDEILSLSSFAKHGLVLSTFFRQAISLTFAVNIVLLPILLYQFHLFPFLSLIYNLFYPFFIGVTMILLLIALTALLLFAPLAYPFFFVTDRLTALLLDLSSYPPSALDYAIRVEIFPAWTIPIFLFLLFNLYLYKEKTSHLTN